MRPGAIPREDQCRRCDGSGIVMPASLRALPMGHRLRRKLNRWDQCPECRGSGRKAPDAATG